MAESRQHANLLLTGGTVVDGTGGPPRAADVAVVGEHIEAVGDLSQWTADRVLQAEGLVVAPGFIDMHSHSDLALLINPRAESKIRQGVTTEVIGQCGSSPAPAPEERAEEMRTHFGPWAKEVEWKWGSFADYLEALREEGTSVNVVPVVGHGTVRIGVMGEERQAPSESELAAMRQSVEEAMQEGAFGLSTGLVYTPGMFASTEEITALARALTPCRGIYFSHIRSESDALLEAVREAIGIGQEAGVEVEIAHLKAEGSQHWGKTEAALEAIAQARQRGVEVSYDCYPYTAWNTGLAQLLPAWAREGGTEEMVGRLVDSETRGRIREALAGAAKADPGRWERRLISSVSTDANRIVQGMSLAEISARRGRPPEEVVMDLLVEEWGQIAMVGFGMCEEDVRRVIAHPIGMIGSDAASAAPYGTLGKGHPHPRTYGTFARVLGRYVREEKVLSLERAVAKMTSMPADKLGLRDRGRIGEGMAADICVFAPEAIGDRATYEKPHEYAQGVRYVIVNGVMELDGEEHQGRLPGRVLARTG